MNVVRLPRNPFLDHSHTLLRHLNQHCGDVALRERIEVLELGCGRQSPFVPLLRDLWPSARLHQIDARNEVLTEAAAFNSDGVVEHMFATDMSAIPDASKDAVIAMSFFDQNLDSAIVTISHQVNRVLRPGGLVLYIHNEQLNVPATSMSTLYEMLNPPTEKPDPKFMLPSDRWEPTNDLEYCLAAVKSVDHALVTLGSSGLYLKHYLQAIYPDIRQLGGAQASVAPQMSVEDLQHVRQAVALMRKSCDVAAEDRSTAELLASRIEPVIGCETFGFETICAGTFEIRQCVPWSRFFREKPGATCFVRGLTALGYSTDHRPEPMPQYRQELNRSPTRLKDEIELVGYQYGFVGRKI